MKYYFYLALTFFSLGCLAITSSAQDSPGFLETGQNALRLPSFNPAMVQPAGLTQQQAMQLLVMALKYEKYGLGKSGIFITTMDFDKKPFANGYYSFGLSYASPHPKPTDIPSFIGSFSVNATTGDIWENSKCKRLEFSGLKKIQAEIIQKTHKTMPDDKTILYALNCPDPSIAASIHWGANYYEDTRKLISTSPFNPDTVKPSGLTEQQAKKLLLIVLKHDKYNLADASIYIEGPFVGKNNSPFLPGYYSFGLNNATNKALAVAVLGHYGISINTGAVWDTDACKRYDFPELKQLQIKIMQKTGKTMHDDPDPGC